jgi:hypothetical protein
MCAKHADPESRDGCVPREAVRDLRPLVSDVIPAKAGIQYCRALVIDTKALEYWVARLRGR